MADIRAYEAGLYPYLDTNALPVLQSIRATGKLESADEEQLKQALEHYTAQFLTNP